MWPEGSFHPIWKLQPSAGDRKKRLIGRLFISILIKVAKNKEITNLTSFGVSPLLKRDPLINICDNSVPTKPSTLEVFMQWHVDHLCHR